MADATIKPDSGNELVLQNNGGTGKIEVNDGAEVKVTTGSASGDDFTVNTSQLVVKGDSGHVGIGIASPTTFSGYTTVHHKNPSGDTAFLSETNGGVINEILTSDSNSCAFKGTRSAHALKFRTNQYERMSIASSANDTADVTLTKGNLVIGTAGKGIDFSADGEAGEGTPHQIFDDYEIGEWNPMKNNGVTLTNNNTPRYVKIGQQVVLYFDVTVASNNNNNAFDLSNFPISMGYSEHGHYGGFITHSNYSSSEIRFNLSTNTRATFYIGTSAILISQSSTYRFAGQIHFITSD